MRGAVGLPAVKITKAGLPRIFTRLAVVLIAAKSNALGRQGINTRSAASTAALAALSAWGGVSITMNAAPWPVACSILAARRGGALSITTGGARSEEHTSELQSLMRNSYAVFCLKKKTNKSNNKHNIHSLS